jgi:hypothetical protein
MELKDKYDYSDKSCRITLKKVTRNDFNNVIKLIEGRGLKRDFDEEKDLVQFASNKVLSPKGEDERVYSGVNSKAMVQYYNSGLLVVYWESYSVSGDVFVRNILDFGEQ